MEAFLDILRGSELGPELGGYEELAARNARVANCCTDLFIHLRSSQPCIVRIWEDVYAIVPCAVKMSISSFEGVKGSIVAPGIVARGVCPKSNAGNTDISARGLHNHEFWERHCSDCASKLLDFKLRPDVFRGLRYNSCVVERCLNNGKVECERV